VCGSKDEKCSYTGQQKEDKSWRPEPYHLSAAEAEPEEKKVSSRRQAAQA
jgi:hypothetical protein